MKLILSCEHGGNKIPEKYKGLFLGNEAILETHRGYDFGTLDLFGHLKGLAVFSKKNTVSRLLIECNRSLNHRQLFSEFTKNLSIAEKEIIIKKYYLPYRYPFEESIQKEIQNGHKILHLSLHSFAPKLHGETRNNDVGLLYDPKNSGEKEWCNALKHKLIEQNPDLKIRFNYPYLGSADGFTTFLRKKFPANYLGIELELNQAMVSNNSFSPALKSELFKVISKIIGD